MVKMTTAEKLPLIAWDEVPEGHYVWAWLGGSYRLYQRKGNELFEPGMSRGILPSMTLARAEQQPGEHAADHSECHDLVCNTNRAKYPRGTAGVGCSCRGRDSVHVELVALRDGLTALTQEMREHYASGQPAFDFQVLEWTDRLAALREGR